MANTSKIKEQLPYLGISDDNENLILFDEIIERPNYDKIKSNRTISLKDSIRILLGIQNLDIIAHKEARLIPPQTYRDHEHDTWLVKHIDTKTIEKNYSQVDKQHKESWYFIINFIHKFLKKVSLEVETGDIKRYGYENLIAEWDNGRFLYHVTQKEYRYNFKTIPFLKWANESGYNIPTELSSLINSEETLKSADPNEAKILSGKEKQELGRLRLEKIKMDLTVKAAINVGRHVEQADKKGKHFVRKEIEDIIIEIDPDIPFTKIDLIWKSIPDNLKHGPGRPPKK